MTTWSIVIIASLAVAATKLIGYLVPPKLFEPPRIRRSIELLPAALLSALIVTQTFSTGQALTIDARAVGLVVAALLYWVRAPFIVAVVAAMAATALVRLFF